MPTRVEIVAEARTWLGVPWRHQGRVLPDGRRVDIDCAGLIEAVGNATGAINYIGPTDYRREAEGLAFLQHFLIAGFRLKRMNLATDGDVLVFRTEGAVYARHCGIRATDRRGRPSVIHAFGKPSVLCVREEPLSNLDLPLVACYEFPNLSDGGA